VWCARGMQSEGFLDWRLGSYVLRSMLVAVSALLSDGDYKFCVDLNLREIKKNKRCKKFTAVEIYRHVVVSDVTKKGGREYGILFSLNMLFACLQEERNLWLQMEVDVLG
jgi:hypothetical protein